MGNSALGARYGAKLTSFGPWGASRGATTATRMSARTITAPAVPSGWRVTKRARVATISGVPDAGIQPGVEQIHEQVHQQEDQRHHEDQGLDGGIVPLAHGLDERGAHAGDHEDDLHDHQAAEQPAAPPPDRS